MTAFTSRWLDWKPLNSTEDGARAGNGGVRSTAHFTPETPIQRTDKTDKLVSEGVRGQIVSFVSATPKRFQPETGCDAEHGGIREQARLNGGNSPNGWGNAAEAFEWFLASETPAEPFVMVWGDRGILPAITISDPARFWRDLRTDIAAGFGLGRDHVGAVRNDLRQLHGLFGGDRSAASPTALHGA